MHVCCAIDPSTGRRIKDRLSGLNAKWGASQRYIYIYIYIKRDERVRELMLPHCPVDMMDRQGEAHRKGFILNGMLRGKWAPALLLPPRPYCVVYKYCTLRRRELCLASVFLPHTVYAVSELIDWLGSIRLRFHSVIDELGAILYLKRSGSHLHCDS